MNKKSRQRLACFGLILVTMGWLWLIVKSSADSSLIDESRMIYISPENSFQEKNK